MLKNKKLETRNQTLGPKGRFQSVAGKELQTQTRISKQETRRSALRDAFRA